MPLYNQTLLTAMDIARTVDEMNRLTYEKAREDLMVQISKMYYLAQNTAEQIRLVEGNIGRLEELRDITTAFYENDMAVENCTWEPKQNPEEPIRGWNARNATCGAGWMPCVSGV